MDFSQRLHSASDQASGSGPKPGAIAVCVISHDPATRESVSKLVRSEGFRVEAFASTDAWTAAVPRQRRGCVILDVQDRDLIGTKQLQRISAICARCCVVVMIDRGNVPVAVSALKVGALDVLEKPISDQELLESIRRAVRMAGEASEMT